MSIAEMKKEINDKINRLDETQLKVVEEFLEKINSQNSEWNLQKHVNEILNERA
jgi:hypothetical protein